MLNSKEKALFCGFIVSVLISFAGFSGKCENISEKILRLHVLANSDSEKDQELKLKVRDRVLLSCENIFNSNFSLDEACKKANENMQKIISDAQDEVIKNGYDYKINAEITKMHFNTRVYNEVTLPAGTYSAVRITIGEGKGKNWWCVMFPPMCLPAAQEKKELEDVLTHDEVDLVEGGQKYEIKFKIVEIICSFRNWVGSIFGGI